MTAARRNSKKIEEHKLHTQLSARERQMATALRALKTIASYEAAPLSIFASEVEHLKTIAMRALVLMHEVQEGRGLKAPILTRKQQRTWAKLKGHVERFKPLYGSIVAEGDE